MNQTAGMRRILHVGCGRKGKAHLPPPFRTEAWEEIRYDIDPAVEPDIVGDITDMSAVATASMDALFSSHNIEHLFWHDVPRALAEFARVLKPGSGVAIVTCPDLQSIGQAIAEGRLLEPLYTAPSGPVAPIDVLFGARRSIRRGNHYMAHKTGFTAKILADLMRKAGFESSTAVRQQKSYALWAIGYRWAASEAERHAAHAAYTPVRRRGAGAGAASTQRQDDQG